MIEIDKSFICYPTEYKLENFSSDTIIYTRAWKGLKCFILINDTPEIFLIDDGEFFTGNKKQNITKKFPNIVTELWSWSLPKNTLLEGTIIMCDGDDIEVVYKDKKTAIEKLIKIEDENELLGMEWETGYAELKLENIYFFNGNPLNSFTYLDRYKILEELLELNDGAEFIENTPTFDGKIIDVVQQSFNFSWNGILVHKRFGFTHITENRNEKDFNTGYIPTINGIVLYYRGYASTTKGNITEIYGSVDKEGPSNIISAKPITFGLKNLVTNHTGIFLYEHKDIMGKLSNIYFFGENNKLKIGKEVDEI